MKNKLKRFLLNNHNYTQVSIFILFQIIWIIYILTENNYLPFLFCIPLSLLFINDNFYRKNKFRK